MKLILFLIPFAFAADFIVTTATDSTEVNCTYPLCALCNSTSAYLINDISTFQIPGYLATTSILLQDMIEELSIYVNASSYTVAVGQSGLCVEANEIGTGNNLEDMYKDFLQVEYKEIVLIEIFDSETVLSQVVGRAERGGGSGYGWTDLKVKHDTFDSAVVSSSVTLGLEEVWQMLEKGSQGVEYFGIAYLGLNAEFEDEFRILASYDRKEGEDFNVTIFNEVTLLGDWADALDPYAGCSRVESPRGLSSVQQLLPGYANIVFLKNETEVFVQVLTTVQAGSPDFSIAQGILVENPIAYLNIYHSEPLCKLDIKGEWNVPDVPQLTIDVLSSTLEHFKAKATISDSLFEISFEEIEKVYKELQSDLSYIFPQYQTEASIHERLYGVKCLNTELVLSFEPETFVTLACDGKILEEFDSKITGYFGRFEKTVENALMFTVSSKTSLSYILGDELPSYATITNMAFNSSTSGINLANSYLMLPYTFEAGIHIAYDVIKFNNCTGSTTCEPMTVYNLTDPINMIGEYFPGDFYAEGGMDVFQIAAEVYMYDTVYTDYFDPPKQAYIRGTLDVVADSESVQPFNANITLGEDEYIMTGRMLEEWTEVFEMKTLSISSLELSYKFKDLEILAENNIGVASFACGDDKYCWIGESNVVFDHNSYQYNTIKLLMEPAESKVFFNGISGIDPTLLAQAFNFTAGSTIDVQYRESANTQQGISVVALAEFLTLPCDVYMHTDINEDTIVAEVDMVPFSMGNGNIKISNVTGQDMQIDLTIDKYNTTGSMAVTASLFYVTDFTSLTMDDSMFKFNIEGFQFNGIYNLVLYVEAETTLDITTTAVTVLADLSVDDLAQFDIDMFELLEQWVNQGLTALYICEERLDAQKEVVSVSESFQCTEECPTQEICTKPVTSYCVDYSYAMDCLQNSTACDSVSVTCYSYTVYCLEETTYCTGYEKNMPNVCKEYKTECINTVDVCDKWNLDCIGEQTGNCEVIDFISTGECGNIAFRCEMVEVPDMQCQSSCDYNAIVLEDEKNRLVYYEDVYAETETELSGFRELSKFTDYIEILSASMSIQLSESGIGPGDIYFTFVFEIPDITAMEMVSITVTILWDSYDHYENLDRIFEEAKSAIIERSSGTLSEDLLMKSPLEVYLEDS